MYHPEWVTASLKLVLENKGSRTAGSDGITKEHLKDEKTREAFSRSIVYEIKNGIYKPEPARRLYIKKEKGGERPLSIPTLKDRVVQQTLKLIIEPIFESDFLDCSIGFRPNRCCHDALPVFYRSIQKRLKYYWIIEGDIRKCFDSISHKILMRLIKKRIKDKRLLGLIKDILKAGYIENGKVNKPGYGIPSIGTPQGAICSPLFANIYMHEFDKWIDENYINGVTRYEKHKRRKAGYGNVQLIRFADDFVLLFNGRRRMKEKDLIPPNVAVDAETMKGQMKRFLEAELELELSFDKTQITHVNSGFEFLGFQIKRHKQRNRYVVWTGVPEEKIAKFRKKIQLATRQKGANYESVIQKILALNSIISGWAEYYKYTNWVGQKVPDRLDYWISARVFRWTKNKHKGLSWKEIIAKYRHRQKGYSIDGKKTERWNFGVRIEATYVTDSETIWLAKLSDKKSVRYRPKKKLNPFITYQYEVENRLDIDDKWEGRGKIPYANDKYQNNKKLALKRDKYRCRLCGAKVKEGIDVHCHHIDGNNGNHQLDNLATLCIPCHYHAYGKEHEFTF
jgi:group II intron reverse transcriptase/maturase